MTDGTRDDLDRFCELVGDPLAEAIVRDVSRIVSDGLKASAGQEPSDGFFEQIVKPYVTSYVYIVVATELTKRSEQNKSLAATAAERRYG